MKRIPDDPKRRALVCLALLLLLPFVILAQLDEARRADAPSMAELQQEVAAAVQADMRKSWENVSPEKVAADVAAFERLPVGEKFQVELTGRMIRALGSGKELRGDEPLSPVDLHHAMEAHRERLRVERVQAHHRQKGQPAPVSTASTTDVTTQR